MFPTTTKVPGTGIEPAHSCERQILSLLRLPIPPPGQVFKTGGNIKPFSPIGKKTNNILWDQFSLATALPGKEQFPDDFPDGSQNIHGSCLLPPC